MIQRIMMRFGQLPFAVQHIIDFTVRVLIAFLVVALIRALWDVGLYLGALGSVLGVGLGVLWYTMNIIGSWRGDRARLNELEDNISKAREQQRQKAQGRVMPSDLGG